MENLDLNINNYDLDSILKLFNITIDFTYGDLKRSIKKLYLLHPDKSGLEPKYFIFFKEAYSFLLNLYKFREKTTNTFREDYYSDTMALKLKKFIKDKDFNQNFNKLFEETFKRETHGYDDWLKTETPVFDGNKDTYFSRQHNKAIIRSDDIKSYNSGCISNSLDQDEEQSDYGNLNQSLKYDDIKKVYSETYIPVNNNDERINQFTSVKQLEHFRSTQNYKNYTKKESQQILLDKERQDINKNNYRLFNLIQQDNIYKDKRNKWWQSFNKLCF